MEELSNLEKRVLRAVGAAGGVASPDQVLAREGLTELVQVMNSASWLQSKGLVNLHDTVEEAVVLTDAGKAAIREGLPERRVLRALAGGPLTVDELKARLDAQAVNVAIGVLRKGGLANLEQGRLVATEKATHPTDDERVLERVAARELPPGAYGADLVERLKRRGLLRVKETRLREIRLTEKGRRILEKGVEVKDTVAQLTPELIASGKWRHVELRPYDVKAFAPVATGGKKHPLRQIIDEIRRVFLEMGFTEIEGAFVCTAFWNMDALFTPQDHPAREMQDTFYLSPPLERAVLLDRPLVAAVKAVHEHGGTTGSTGWRNPWSEDVAAQRLLRTHTTVDTIRYLHDHRDEPAIKVFSVDRVFRNEAVDATHLPEFHQVEGVVMEPGANFRQLLGLLKTFYAKMGFEDIRVRPAYFPYTEPSLELEVFYNGKWMELGGAGMFRPEVLEPVGVKHPVLAWGLGLERLAMMRLGLKDLRELYVSDVEWLRNAPLAE